ncbi:MAG: chemotaxis protein CheB [Blastocatellia bacterium]|nr:MAG: chemotaxis protein CheB [Blastocatellia bacterium]
MPRARDHLAAACRRFSRVSDGIAPRSRIVCDVLSARSIRLAPPSNRKLPKRAPPLEYCESAAFGRLLSVFPCRMALARTNFATATCVARRDVVVVGASSGGVEALMTLIAGLPRDFGAAVFVALHTRPDAPSRLPAILNRAGQLPVAHAVDGEPIRRGRVYVATPGMQTSVQNGRIGVRRGPHENLHRPAIDPLFRTAAQHYGIRVIGIVLSGSMDDGSAGLHAIKKAGGLAIIQTPSDAAFPDMPANAATAVEPDYTLPVADLPKLLTELVGSEAPEIGGGQLRPETTLETDEEADGAEPVRHSDELGNVSVFTCPDCNGTLWEINSGERLRYRCRVGHAYSEDTMLKAQSDSVERALWAALRALEERETMMRKMAKHARRRGNGTLATMFEERSEQVAGDARTIHDVILMGRTLEPVQSDV